MCGGIALDFDDVSADELERYFLPEEIDAFRRTGRIESFFWSRRPVLPMHPNGCESDPIKLIDWGNREKNVDLPKTGWARWESVNAGRWNHLTLKEISIPVRRGYEKRVWFDITGTIAGILAEKNGIVRAYMITIPADDEYRSLTGHDRMPKIAKQ